MNIFRLHTKPKDVNPKDAFNYCLQNGVIGMGWQVNSINVSFGISILLFIYYLHSYCILENHTIAYFIHILIIL